MFAPSPIATAPTYYRHRPELTPLYAIVAKHYPRFVQAIEQSGGYLPKFLRQEFDEYLKCGLLEHGFLRVKCDGCMHEHLVAFSCKRRGVCPSCGARRMVESAALIQRFGSALNLNPHLHMLFLYGAYAFRGQRPIFHRARRPVGEELNRLLDTLSRRIVRMLERRGLLTADPAHPFLDLLPDSSLEHLQAASVAYRIAIGPQAGRKALTLYTVPPLDDMPNHPLSWGLRTQLQIPQTDRAAAFPAH